MKARLTQDPNNCDMYKLWLNDVQAPDFKDADYKAIHLGNGDVMYWTSVTHLEHAWYNYLCVSASGRKGAYNRDIKVNGRVVKIRGGWSSRSGILNKRLGLEVVDIADSRSCVSHVDKSFVESILPADKMVVRQRDLWTTDEIYFCIMDSDAKQYHCDECNRTFYDNCPKHGYLAVRCQNCMTVLWTAPGHTLNY